MQIITLTSQHVISSNTTRTRRGRTTQRPITAAHIQHSGISQPAPAIHTLEKYHP